MRVFVIRVYRQNLRRLAGVSEDAETGACNAFRGARELTQLLRAAPLKAARSASKRQRAQSPTNDIEKGDTP